MIVFNIQSYTSSQIVSFLFFATQVTAEWHISLSMLLEKYLDPIAKRPYLHNCS